MSPSSENASVPLDATCDGAHGADRLDSLVERLPSDETLQSLSETFRILAEPSRLRLIIAMLEGGELCVCELAAASGLSQTACSHNLRLLRAGRLVRHRKQGRNVFYALDDSHIRLLLDVGLAHMSHPGGVPVQEVGSSRGGDS